MILKEVHDAYCANCKHQIGNNEEVTISSNKKGVMIIYHSICI